jgi:cytochrome c oxidase subunit IV
VRNAGKRGQAVERADVHGHVLEYPVLIRVWLLLLVLTGALVFVSRQYHEALSVWAMLTLTPLKAGLVFYYFMHLKYEMPFIKAMVIITLALLVVFIGLTFFDIWYR